MKEISIIIPNYNGEKYISQCLKSIYDNVFDDNLIEIIIIDDCSNDNSIDIINKYAKKNKSLKLIELNKNLVVSNARNIGIKMSKGKYLFFLDSDDLLKKDSLKLLLEYSKKNYDIVYFDYNIITNSNARKSDLVMDDKEFIINDNFNKDIFELFLYSYKLNHVWGELIKSSIAKKNKFDTNLIMAEDFKYNLEIFFSSKRILLSNKKILSYRIHNNNITNTKNKNKILKKSIDSFNSYNELFKYDLSRKYNNKILRRIEREFLNSMFGLYKVDKKNFKEEYLNCINLLDKNKLKKVEKRLKYHIVKIKFVNRNNIFLFKNLLKSIKRR